MVVPPSIKREVIAMSTMEVFGLLQFVFGILGYMKK